MENLYRACVYNGLPPRDFWEMTPIEPWWFLSIKCPDLFKNTELNKKKNQISASEMLAKMKKHDEVR